MTKHAIFDSGSKVYFIAKPFVEAVALVVKDKVVAGATVERDLGDWVLTVEWKSA